MERIFSLLKTAVAIIAFLFGAFNNFLDKYAPPPLNYDVGSADTVEFTVSVAKFINLAVLLFISLLFNYQGLHNYNRKKKLVRNWIWITGASIVAFIFSAFIYQSSYEEKTFTPFGTDRYVRGKLNEEAMKICKSDYPQMDIKSCEVELMNDVSSEGMNAYWIEGSREKFRNDLKIKYLIMVILLATILFSLIEVLGWSLFQTREKED